MEHGNLLSELKRIEKSDFAHLDRGAEYSDAIRRYNKNGLVMGAIDGRIYLPEEFDMLIERVGGKRLYYPNSPSKEDYRKIAEFNQIVGDAKDDIRGSSFINNPVMVFGNTAALLSGASILFNKLGKEGNKKTSRRDFIESCIKIGAFSALLGGISLVDRAGDNRKNNKKRKDVEYVQKMIEQYSRL